LSEKLSILLFCAVLLKSAVSSIKIKILDCLGRIKEILAAAEELPVEGADALLHLMICNKE
jgi:hypothetical protein